MRLFHLFLVTLMFYAPALATQSAMAQDRTAGTQPRMDDPAQETYRQLDLFGDVFERVREQYVEEKTDKELVENALNGMLNGLDPHSSYLNEDSFEDMRTNTRGEFGGLGIEVTMENGLVKVVSPIDETPAARAGIMAGDYIVQINDEPVMGMTLEDAVDQMRGKVGTTIDLIVTREGAEAPIEITLERAIIKIRSVRHRVEGNAGYIRVTTFNQHAAGGVKTAMEEIKEELGNKLAGYVLDLRNNPGGLLDQGIEVADIFLDKGEIVSTRGRHESDTQRANASSGDLANDLPVVVLINGGSASAAEIVAGALQDHKRAILLGTQSFGKGSVQTVIPLPGYGAMRLTTARYYTPSGRSIQAKGIEPDIIVEPAKIETIHGERFGEANLRGALKNNDEKDSKAKKTKNVTKEDAEDEEPIDYQLLRALDLLNGLSLYRDSATAVQAVKEQTEAAKSETPKAEQ
ncbi:MAG: S41 family peptidase [Micavibrio sp.]|nr:S41 family peptidase [Micavibrio sp.]